MKKTLSIVLCLILVCGAVVGCAPSSQEAEVGVTQEEYDALNSQLEAEKAKTNDDIDETSSIQSALDSMTSERDQLKLQVEDLEAEIITLEEESLAKEEGDVADSEDGLELYDDEYVTISYLGCEQNSWDEDSVVFYAINKTDNELTFQSSSLAINGESLGHVFGSDSVAPQGKGSFSFSTNEAFPTMTPSTLTITIKVIDFEKTLFDKQSYEVKLVNAVVDGSEEAPLEQNDNTTEDDQ